MSIKEVRTKTHPRQSESLGEEMGKGECGVHPGRLDGLEEKYFRERDKISEEQVK